MRATKNKDDLSSTHISPREEKVFIVIDHSTTTTIQYRSPSTPTQTFVESTSIVPGREYKYHTMLGFSASNNSRGRDVSCRACSYGRHCLVFDRNVAPSRPSCSRGGDRIFSPPPRPDREGVGCGMRENVLFSSVDGPIVSDRVSPLVHRHMDDRDRRSVLWSIAIRDDYRRRCPPPPPRLHRNI